MKSLLRHVSGLAALAAMALLAAPDASAQNDIDTSPDFQEGGICYHIDRTRPAYVGVTYNSQYGDIDGFYSGHIVVPESVEHDGKTYEVRYIYKSAFSNAKKMTAITIPQTVDYIYTCAFGGCTALEEVVFEDGNATLDVADQGEYTNRGTFTGLPVKKAYIGRDITYDLECSTEDCGYAPFYKVTTLEEVTFGDMVTSIPFFLCSWCTGLKKVNLGSGIDSIETMAFMHCHALEEIKFPASLTLIGDAAFKYCYGFKKIEFEDSDKVLDLTDESSSEGMFSMSSPDYVYIGRKITFINPPFTYSGLKSVKLGGSLKAIEPKTFMNCQKLESVDFGDAEIVSIGNSAFESCIALKKLDLPESVKTYGTYVLSGTGLESFTFPKNLSAVPKGMLSGCTSLREVVIGDNITSFGSEVFVNCSMLFSIKCEGLTPPACNVGVGFTDRQFDRALLTVPESAVNDYASAPIWCDFRNINQMNVNYFKVDGISYLSQSEGVCEVSYPDTPADYSGDIEIPAMVTCDGKDYTVVGVGESAFYQCSRMTSIKLPETTTYVAGSSFYGCTKLETVTVCSPGAPSMGYDAFKKVDTAHCILSVPDGCFLNYKNSDWKIFKKITETASVADLLLGDDDAPVFNLDGLRIHSSVEALPAGIYIIGGRKTLIGR